MKTRKTFPRKFWSDVKVQIYSLLAVYQWEIRQTGHLEKQGVMITFGQAFIKPSGMLINYFPESECPNSLMPVQNLENWSSFSHCASRSGICRLLLGYAQPLWSCFPQRTGQTTSAEQEMWYVFCSSKSDTCSHFSFYSNLALLPL